ncbi:LysR substrate-binding domain-containing protein [Paraburkholderia tuberum]|uniref:DNA-binding transcriptional regulator, LysR family n=1 Tax=Paraburkholderia tuberum TaxID=157910 RepID=A0A1H1KGY7_9BURK|nr:LysR substrate-binding domain-containing protein [Paraburkholderia tuberum]SDR61591.1 DNA-binding transcriptional regulator, LysR family [Paraburkholderia tuberum]
MGQYLHNSVGQHPAISESVLIGSTALANGSWLVDGVCGFRKLLPGCRLKIRLGVSLNLVGQVLSGEADGAIIIKPPFSLPVDLKWHPLATEQFVVLVPESLKNEHWRDLLSSRPFLRFGRDSFNQRHVDSIFEMNHVSHGEVIELDDLNTVMALVAKGVGVSIVPGLDGIPMPHGVTTLPLGGATFSREIGIVERQELPRRAQVQVFVRSMSEAAGSKKTADKGRAR